MTLFVVDDAVARQFEPFALTRPWGEMRAGAELLRHRWELALGEKATGTIAALQLSTFDEPGGSRVWRAALPAGTILANARFAVSLAGAPRDATVWRNGGRIAAVRLNQAVSSEQLDAMQSLDDLPFADDRAVEIDGWWIDDIWDVVRHLTAMLASDIPLIARRLQLDAAPPTNVLGSHEVCIERGARVEPLVVFDASAGPILVRREASIASFTRLVGPCVIGEGSQVSGGKIAASSIGEACRVHGELSMSIFVGHSNKSHDGFIGHSVLGRWVNLGASTVNSNLKNTYGTVSLWTPTGFRDTGMQFLGTFFGDHVKTAIGTRITTGCVIGAGANVFGTSTVPKVVEPFAWGHEGNEITSLERFLVTAERMMARRNVSLGERGRLQLTAAYVSRWGAET